MLRAGLSSAVLRQRGLSIVELMVGVAIGLFVVAAATMLVSMQLSESRRLMLETQVQQDLRASADIITRELRRAGHWGTARQGIWNPDTPAAPPLANPYAEIRPVGENTVFVDDQAETSVVFAYARSGNEALENGLADGAEQSGFRRAVVDGKGVIQTQLGDGNWQALTDGNTLNVTAFTLTMNRQPIRLECPRPCPDPAIDCRPILEVRELIVVIVGEAANDSSVTRRVDSRVRLRNDAFEPGTCPA